MTMHPLWHCRRDVPCTPPDRPAHPPLSGE
jgi:hypothetical protein